MQAFGRQPQRAPDGAPFHHERHRPEKTTLYRLVQQHAASFIAHTEASTGSELPQFIKAEPDADGDEARTLRPLQAVAVTFRIAFGPRAGRKVLTLRGAERGHGTVPADGPVPREGLAHARRERGLQGMPRETTVHQALCAGIDGNRAARRGSGGST